MLDVTSLLEEIKASPFEEQEIVAPHTGVVTFGSLKLGDKVIGPNGTWKERNAHRHHHARTQPKAAQRGPEGRSLRHP